MKEGGKEGRKEGVTKDKMLSCLNKINGKQLRRLRLISCRFFLSLLIIFCSDMKGFPLTYTLSSEVRRLT